MKRRANPTLVGAFVVGAAAIAVAGIVAFGSGRLFRQTEPLILHFEGQVNGLNVGAPVKLKGVEIGSVEEIRLRLGDDEGIRIPVLVEVDPARITAEGSPGPVFDQEGIREQIARGLRARLEQQSFVTGLLFVQLDYHPDTPANLVGSPGPIPEVPTLPTRVEVAQSVAQQILERLDAIDFQALIVGLTDAARAVDGLAGSKEIRQAIASADETLAEVRGLVGSLEAQIGPLAKSLERTARETGEAVRELENTLRATRSLVEPGSPLAVRLATALEEITTAARSIRLLADSLERDPSAIVRGRASGERAR